MKSVKYAAASLAVLCFSVTFTNTAFAKYLIITEPTFQSNVAQTNATNLGLDFDTISLAGLSGSNGATLAATYSTLYLAPAGGGLCYL